MVKNPPASAGDPRDMGLILGSGRCPGERNGNPLQYSRLENPMDGGAWRAMVHGITDLDTTERLSKYSCNAVGGYKARIEAWSCIKKRFCS